MQRAQIALNRQSYHAVMKTGVCETGGDQQLS